jgi:LEA14-like dessication related protein
MSSARFLVDVSSAALAASMRIVMRVFVLLLAAAASAAPSAREIRITPQTDGFTAIVSCAAPGASAGAFSGALSLNKSAAEIPVSGAAQVSGERATVTVNVKYKDVPEDWANRFRIADFDYRLHGRVAGGRDIDCSGALRWDAVEVENGQKTAAANFIKLGSIRMTEFSLLQSSAKADVTVTNPLSFPLKIASTSYRLFANGQEVGSGSTKGMVLHAAQQTTLELPIEIDHSSLLGAAGSSLAAGGDIDGRLQGTLVIRLAGGDISVPLDAAGRVSLFK